MNKVNKPTERSAFFPSKTRNKANKKRTLKTGRSLLRRNNNSRKKELENITKKDVKVNIPDAIKDFSRIKKAVDEAPLQNNSNKIARLKQQIKEGKYQIDYDALADKILSSEY